jgi:hypothetical protein
MHRLIAISAAFLVSIIGFTTIAGAQHDLGNDGIDKDCGDFVEMNAAQGYFEFDGGSAGRNVDDLDASGDGFACRDATDRAGEDTGSDDVAVLPRTGAGTIARHDSSQFALLLLVGVTAAIGFAAACAHRRGQH